jgi:Transposase DDE domain
MRAKDVQGTKYVALFDGLLDRLRPIGAERDRAGNRELFYDQYLALLLVYFFSPAVTSLRALQQATALDVVQKKLGIRQVSLGSLSEAARVFDAEHAQEILRELAGRAVPLVTGDDAKLLKNLTAVDGSLFQTVARASWALWQDEQHRAAKLHLQLSVWDGTPRNASVTAGNASETDELAVSVEPDRIYVLDRGYFNYDLYRRIRAVGSSFVARIKETAVFEEGAERPLTEKARAAGVIRDVELKSLGVKDKLTGLRLVVVKSEDDDGKPIELWLLTDRLDLPAELVATAYRLRWTIELYFRWFKRLLGCRHLISTSENGVTLQLYAALIASLLIVLWTGLKVNKRTWEMVQYYFMGWATAAELERHILSRLALPPRRSRKS